MKKIFVLAVILVCSLSAACNALESSSTGSSGYSSRIAEAINSYLESRDYTYAFNEKSGVFNFGFRIDGRLRNLEYQISIRRTNYVVYASSSINADIEDKKMMSEMAQFVCWANYGLRRGNFELDMSDGEIRYKDYVDCEDRRVTFQMVRNSILIPAMMFERYSPGILDIIFMGSNAEEAIKKCED